MLREIGSIRQDSDRGLRRWFQDDYFDLFVWQDTAGIPIAFQLCYERERGEGAISWRQGQGYAHARVDSGAQTQRHGMAPLLRSDRPAPYYRVYNRFLDASAGWEPALRQLLLEHLRTYKRLVFGTRRTPRRKRRSDPARVDSR